MTPPAIVATDQGDGTVELAVSNAAHASAPAYTSDFSAGVDSWSTAALSGSPTAASTGPAPDGSGTTALYFQDTYADAAADTWAQRAITGRTAGHTYRMRATIQLRSSSSAASCSCELTTTVEPETVTVTISKGAPVVVEWDVVAAGTTITPVVHPFGIADRYVAVWDVTVSEVTAGFEPWQLQRQDANGAHLVRLPEGAEPDSSGNVTVIDAEPALGGLVTYVVRDGLGNTAEDTLTLDYPTPLISTVGYLTTLDVGRVDGYSGSRSYQAQTSVLPIMGRAAPLATNQGDATWGLREGTLTYAPCSSYEDAQAIVDVYTSGRVVMLRQATHPGLDLYHVALRIDGPTPVYLAADGWRWQVAVQYVEVGWPSGELFGSALWTYDDLAAFVVAYWNIPEDFPLYSDLRAGP